MIQTTLRIVPTRTAREIMLGKRFQVQARFPGGRIIPLGYAKTRSRANQIARVAATPSGSPTDGGFAYQAGVERSYSWKGNSRQVVQIP